MSGAVYNCLHHVAFEAWPKRFAVESCVRPQKLIISAARMFEVPQIDPHSEPPSIAWSANRVAIPIVFGVAGHIDLDPNYCESIKQTLRRLFDDFRSRYPHSERVLLTSLAAGNDQLAAEVALDCGVRIVVPLPFPAKYYAESSTFKKDAGAAQRMLDYVSRANIISFVVPLKEVIEDDDELRWRQMIADPEERHKCYANAGGYITRRCPALIALWDGQRPIPGKPSGTAEMVNCKLYGTTPKLYPFPRPLLLRADGGPVYAVHTPRIRDPEKADRPTYQPGALRVLLPPKADAYNREIFNWRSNRFSRFLIRLSQAFGLARPKLSTSAWLDFHGVCQMIDDFNAEAKRHDSATVDGFAKSQKLPFWQWPESGSMPKTLRRVIALCRVLGRFM